MAPISHRSPTSPKERASTSTSATSEDGSSRRSSESTEFRAALAVRELSKSYRDARGQHGALDGVSFGVRDGETLVVLGPSGAGKTTLLRVIAGLETPERGDVLIDGRSVIHVPVHQRRAALVFQEDALFPHLTIRDNLAFAMRLRRVSPRETEERVRSVAASLQIEEHLRERPGRLSGGERQRAAIARAVLSDPRVLLLDEPLAHLDPQLRTHVRAAFAHFRRSFAGAAVYVTHDHLEALTIGDRLAIMIDGRIVQQGAPQEVYDAPADVRVARFFGSPPMNLIETGGEILGIRPEHVRIDPLGTLRARIVARESTGPDVYLRAIGDYGELLIRAAAQHNSASPGDEVNLHLDGAFLHHFDRITGRHLT